jgi:hypothetical protein
VLDGSTLHGEAPSVLDPCGSRATSKSIIGPSFASSDLILTSSSSSEAAKVTDSAPVPRHRLVTRGSAFSTDPATQIILLKIKTPVYAFQARDGELAAWSVEIRERAVLRLGELNAEGPKAKGGRHKKIIGIKKPPIKKVKSLSDLAPAARREAEED